MVLFTDITNNLSIVYYVEGNISVFLLGQLEAHIYFAWLYSDTFFTTQLTGS